MSLLKKFSVKVPKNIRILYLSKKNIIVFIGPLGKKMLKLKLKLFFQPVNYLIYVERKSDSMLLKNQKQLLKALQGTIVAMLKQCILEVSIALYKKLELRGVGYKVYLLKKDLYPILHFTLGYSHSLFFKIESNNLKVLTQKATNLFIFGNSYNKISCFASHLRSFKYPEPYKGKGILYQNEKIALKEGKKI